MMRQPCLLSEGFVHKESSASQTYGALIVSIAVLQLVGSFT